MQIIIYSWNPVSPAWLPDGLHASDLKPKELFIRRRWMKTANRFPACVLRHEDATSNYVDIGWMSFINNIIVGVEWSSLLPFYRLFYVITLWRDVVNMQYAIPMPSSPPCLLLSGTLSYFPRGSPFASVRFAPPESVNTRHNLVTFRLFVLPYS